MLGLGGMKKQAKESTTFSSPKKKLLEAKKQDEMYDREVSTYLKKIEVRDFYNLM